MLQSSLSISGSEVLISGTLVTEIYDDILISLSSENPGTYELQIVFIEKPESPGLITNYSSSTITNRHIVEVVNSGGNAVMSNSKPIYVADWKGKRIFLNFACHPIGFGSAGKRITYYTLFEGGLANG